MLSLFFPPLLTPGSSLASRRVLLAEHVEGRRPLVLLLSRIWPLPDLRRAFVLSIPAKACLCMHVVGWVLVVCCLLMLLFNPVLVAACKAPWPFVRPA